MSFDDFLDDLRQLRVPKHFEGGNDKQRIHLNEVIAFLEGVTDAADRRAGDNADADEVAIVITEDGDEATYDFLARRRE